MGKARRARRTSCAASTSSSVSREEDVLAAIVATQIHAAMFRASLSDMLLFHLMDEEHEAGWESIEGDTNEQLVKKHERMIELQKRMLNDQGILPTVQATSSSCRKPKTDFAKLPNLNSCTPIHVRALQPGSTHKGRLLRGTIVSSKPCVFEGVAVFLAKDEMDDVVKVAVTNFVPMEGLSQRQQHHAACQSLRQGTHILIVEPYYKIMPNGDRGIHTNNPSELVFLEHLGPTDISGWQEEGKKHFQAKQYVEAMYCYNKALELLDKDSCLTNALLNLSATMLKLQQPESALSYAGAATALQPNNNKAWYRMALALDCSARPDIARYCMERSAQLTPSITPVATANLLSLLRNTNKKSISTSVPADFLTCRLHRALASCASSNLGTARDAQGTSAASLDQGSSRPAHDESAAARAEGNEHFKQGRWAEALMSYTAALQPVISQAGVLLSDRAAARLLLPGKSELFPAFKDAQAACDINPNNAEAHLRRSTALLQLEWLVEARQACDEGLKLAPEDPDLLESMARIETAQKAASSAKATTRNGAPSEDTSSCPVKTGQSQLDSKSLASTSKQGKADERKQKHELKERELHIFSDDTVMQAEQQSHFKRVMAMMMSKKADSARRLQQYRMPQPTDIRVPPFHEEFVVGRWPHQCDVTACFHHLWSVYEDARRVNNISEAWILRKSEQPVEKRFNPLDMIRRLGSTDTAALRWFLKAKPGDVRFRNRQAYNSDTLHSFPCVPCRKEALKPGTTHVAVGFLDLGGLCESLMAWGPQQMSDAGCEEGILTWVGFDASAYSTAKTLVIATMAKLDAAVDDILQVWYSSCWSRSALIAFRKAITHILEDPNSISSDIGGGVLKLLTTWRFQDVPLCQARKGWLESSEGMGIHIANFTRKEDRMALCRYVITGSLLEEEVGSVVMFAIPPKFGERAEDELFLQNLPYSELMHSWVSQPSLDIVAVGIQHLRRRIARLKECLTTGRVVVKVHARAVKPDDKAVHAQISQLKPYTMSWSNVPDYIDPVAFHKMARACSAPGCKGTIHYMQSFNWVQEVKGSTHMDYMLTKTGEKQSEVTGLLGAVRDAVKDMYGRQGLKHLLLSPPIDDARNLIDFGFFRVCYEFWVKAFFDKAGLEDSHAQVKVVQKPCYNVFSCTNAAMYIAFTYDPAVHFVPIPS